VVEFSYIKEEKAFEFQRKIGISKVFYQNVQKLLTEQSFCGRI